MADIAVLGLRVDASGAIVATEQLGNALNDLGQKGDKATSGLSNGFKKLAGAVSAALVIKKFVDESITAQNSQAQLEAAIRSTGGAAGKTVEQLQATASKLQQFTKFSDDAVQGAQALLLTFTKIKGDNFDKATVAAANLATRLGGDLNGAALQVGKALQDPERGVNALRRAGVSFSQTQLEVIKNLQETGQQGKAQAIILAELEKEFGGAASAARNTLGGALEALKNNFGDLFEISRESGGAVVDIINRIAIFLKVLNDNRQILIDVGKYALISATAFAVWGQQAKIVAFYNGIIAGTQTIANFVALARSIGLAAAAMELFGNAGVLRLVSLAAGIATLILGFLGLKKVLGEFSNEYADLQKQLKDGAKGIGFDPTKVAGADLSGGSQADANALKEAKQAALERVVAAQQALELTKKIGLEEALQVVRNKAINDSIKAQATLKGEALTITQKAIKEELKLAEDTVRAQRSKQLNAENSDRLRIAQQQYALVGLEGEALAKQTIENERINKLAEARRTLTGDELDARTRVIETEAQLATSAAEYNAILERRKAKQEELNNKAKQILEDQKAASADFQRQFLQTVSSGIEGVLKNGLNSFKDFVGSVKDLFLKLFADILAANVFKRLTQSLGSLIPGSQFDLKNVANANFGGSSFLSTAGAVAGTGLAGFGVGSALGGLTTNKAAGGGLGAAGGAAVGAAIGSVVPVIGTAVGAIVGGIAGFVGGILGASKKAKQQLEAQQKVLEAIATLKVGDTASQLDNGIKEIKKQFDELRKATEAAFSGKKNESARNAALADINALEAKRIQQLREEAAEVQRRQQADFKVRELRAKGLDLEAAAMEFAEKQSRELADAQKGGADAATLAQIATTQLAESAKFFADQQKAAAAQAENSRRTLFDLANDARALTDPRGAAQQRDVEEANRRIFDAIQRGASEAELAAIAFYNAAVLAAKEAERVEQDRRTTESLVVRGLNAAGRTREADSADLAAKQRQELADAIKNGFSPTNLALLQFVQFSERAAFETKRAIEDGTKAINDRAKEANDKLDQQIEATRSLAASQIKAINAQIEETRAQAASIAKGFDNQIAAVREDTKARTEAIDAQIEAARNGLEIQKAQLSALEKQVQTNEKVVDALTKFSDSLKLGDLSTLSPEQKLAEARAQFEALAARAQGGDAQAATDLPNAANALLQASRAFNASNPAFAADFARVQDVVAKVTEQFGATLPIDRQILEAARRQVEAGEKSIEALQRQKDAIQKASELQIAKLQEQKDAAQAQADRIIETLEKQRDKISADADATISKLEELKQANLEAAQKQIDQLIADENAKLQTRIRENEFYDTFARYAESSGEYFARALEQLDNPLNTGTTGDGLTPGGTTGGVTPAAPSPVQVQLEATVAELKEVNKTLSNRLERMEDQLLKLTNVTVAASDREVDAIYRNVDATNGVAAEVRNGAQAAAARSRPVGIATR